MVYPTSVLLHSTQHPGVNTPFVWEFPKGIGREYAHVCIDDHTRLACVEVLADEKKETCCGFLRRAAQWFRRQKVTPQSVMTDNGPAYLSKL